MTDFAKYNAKDLRALEPTKQAISREEKLREMAQEEQALMREIYGFDNGVVWERERIIDKLRDRAADLVGQGDMASSELYALSNLIDWLEREQK